VAVGAVVAAEVAAGAVVGAEAGGHSETSTACSLEEETLGVGVIQVEPGSLDRTSTVRHLGPGTAAPAHTCRKMTG
jgi:hypothetical protein